MLDRGKLPAYLYFKNGNTYSSGEGGMRYFLRQETHTQEETGQKADSLLACAWPEPWSVENTDPALASQKTFSPNEAGVTDAMDWLRSLLADQPERWADRPSILDCEPWHPAPEPPDEQDAPPFDL